MIPRTILSAALAMMSGIITADNDADYLMALYQHLHQHPELSFQERETSKRMAQELRKAGLDVTEGVGGYGVVGIFKNGSGPVLMVRADTDALPIEEATALPYASAATAKNDVGDTVPVMHACGHDVHMTALVGSIRRLVQQKDRWGGTLVAIAQPAEERSGGATAMLSDGLFDRFPRPDAAIALHVSADLPAGKVSYMPGYSMANVDMVDVTVFGVGGHGAYPHTTKDPIVLAAQIINGWQTLVARTISPLEAGVVTVGSIHAGTKHNVISDQVDLQLTVRSYSDETRQALLQGIERIAHGMAQGAGLPEDRWPVMKVLNESTPSVYNDPELVDQLAAAITDELGQDRVELAEPVMGGEDFSKYGRVEPAIPIMMFWLGAVDPARYAAAKQAGEGLPSLHSASFAPEPEATISTGVDALTAAALRFLSGP